MESTVTTTSPLDVHQNRLERAGLDVGVKRQLYEDAIALRDRAVVDALDDGLSYAAVAKLAHLSPARVVQILARVG